MPHGLTVSQVATPHQGARVGEFVAYATLLRSFADGNLFVRKSDGVLAFRFHEDELGGCDALLTSSFERGAW